ncbi:hypothetical protein A1O3_02851 [Capronia epimyces CBS 606.96]|uniref:F-box domain-containing protein n=1 Tax=Capronia epimyces CBS 606.96 TaxID=1182542 RepID=W9Z5K1_9EURO|nr:uncharacterized protein A1O3_02851 [Capronia epimyces CBS 606.96]EXJ89784.1 hypothetical protein A1O3_02851 [Capronia epimyces CBS 606.96]
MRSLMTELPDEVVQAILHHLPPRSTAALQQTCRRFVNIANEPLLWKIYCQRDFRWWDERHGIKSLLQDATFTGWRDLYHDRQFGARTTRRAINKIVTEETGRLASLKTILDVGYDAKDTLLDLFRTAPSSEDQLALKYWSHAALGCLHRLLAVGEWVRLSAAEAPIPIDRAIAGFDLFILEERTEGDMDDIFARLDSYAASVRSAYPNIDDMTPRQKAIAITAHLQENQWVGIQGDRHYHSLDHMFLGVALFSENRNSIPLISAIIFSHVACHFGLRAAPCSFPFHVYAVVSPPVGQDLDGNPLPEYIRDHDGPIASEETLMYMDPFRSLEPLSPDDLRAQLNFISPSTSAARVEGFLTPAKPRSLMIRAANNIMASGTHYPGEPAFPVDRNLATYAALFSLVTMTDASGTRRHNLTFLAKHFLEFFELDVHLFERHMLPMTGNYMESYRYHEVIQERKDADHVSPPPKPRSDPKNSLVQFKVGQVFRHRRLRYVAVIYGWDPDCRMQEYWITTNQVDRLPNGRHQPFYNAIVDDQSTRYVAEENVVVLQPSEITEDLLNAFPLKLGKWFKRYDHETGTFVSNVRAEYPDD